MVNGQPVSAWTLSKVVAYVRNDTALCPAMSVEHTLHFHASLRKPRPNPAQVKLDNRDKVRKFIFILRFLYVCVSNVETMISNKTERDRSV